MKYGVQLYSVRDAVKDLGMKETLRRVASIGYSSVELAGFGDLTPEQMKACLDELGLSVDGAHLSLRAMTEDFEATLAALETIGCTRAIVPAAKVKTAEDVRALQLGLAEAAKKFSAHGIEVGFHNHAVEYLPNEDGDIPMDAILAVDSIFIELDTYWAYHAGMDPLSEMERLGNRLKLIHIKDGDPTLEGECGKTLGHGTAPVSAVYQKALEMGIPMVVESETLTPDGPTEIDVCFRYLKSLEN